MMYDIIIIGAGPAGISAGLYAVSRGKKTLVIEKHEVGGLIKKVSSVTHYSGLIEQETGATFAARLKKQAENAGVSIVQETVTEVSLTPTIKTVTTDTHTYEAPHIILACGTTPRRLGIPGELELSGKGVCQNATKDAPLCAGKHVYVVGGADGVPVDYTAPCGVCRQVMMEFCEPDQFQIILAIDREHYRIFTLRELLPMGFGPKNLGRERGI